MKRSGTGTARRQGRSLLRPPELSARASRALTLGLLLGAALGTHLLCLYIGTLDFSGARFFSYFRHPAVFLLNLLPVVLLVALFWFLTNRAWLAFLLPSALLVLVSFINYFKIAIRGDPLIAEDLLLIGEGAGTMGDYELHFPALFFVSFGLVLVGALALMCYARARIPRKRLWVRALGVLACVALGLLSWRLWYGDKALYDAQSADGVFNCEHESERSASRGLLWSFLHSVRQTLPMKPEGYSDAAAQALLARYEDADIPADERVNVVVTMLESFSDLSALGGVTFERDPYADFHALQAESYCGTLISDTNGGGTINAERSFLTGFAYPHSRYRRDTWSYVRYFAAQGYSTQGGHPGYEWFYDRRSVNENLGFSRYDFMENHYEALPTGGSDYRGRPGDAAFFADRRADYLARDPSQPYFSFSVTYQGHSPYSDTALEGGVYCAHDGLSDGAYCMINNYLSSVADTGRQLRAYVDSFREDDAPVVLVFFGDHKPTLGTGNCYYAELGVDVSENDAQGCENLYSVPYLIWANDAARRVLGDRFTGQGETISPSFLMAELFDRCGWDGPAWMQLQRDTRRRITVIHRQELFVVDGKWESELQPDARPLYDELRIAEYYVREKLQRREQGSS